MRNIISFLFIFFCSLSVKSQTLISGVVKNKTGEPMIVTVTLQPTNKQNISGFTSTDADGRYKVAYKGTGDSILVTVRSMMIETATRRIPNRSATIDFIVTEKINKLKEVYVKSEPIHRRGDTLSYVVSQFTGQSDRTIEDALKKMPGIEVSSSGAISYNGKEINKFYIEDLDMLGGRYNLATRNIEADDVASVQIYENHQPIKAESIFSDQTAINLKLKDSAKGVWSVNALAGSGYQPVLWNAELTAMHFAHNRQHISVYKGNNSGYTSEDELLKHYDAGGLPGAGGMLSVSQPGTPNVDKKRYTDNRTNMVSVNQLVKIKDKEWTANINFYNERLDKAGYSYSCQYFPNGETPLVIEENINNEAKENNLDVLLQVESNQDREFFRNRLNIKTSWNQTGTSLISRSNRLEGNNSIFQHLDRPYFTVSNALNMLKRLDRHTICFRFNIDYNDRPHQLNITPAYYFNTDSLELLSQEVIQKDIHATLSTSYGLTLGDFMLNYTPKINMTLNKLSSFLSAEDHEKRFIPAADSMRNDLWYNTYQIGVEQEYTYRKLNRLRIKLKIPTFFYLITDNDRIYDQKTHYKRLLLSPSLMADYSFTPSFKTVLNGYYRKAYGGLEDAYSGYILQSYRNLLRNMTEGLFERESAGGNVALEYRDVIRMLFFSAGTGYQYQHKNLLYGYAYNGVMGMKTTTGQPTDRDFYNVSVSASKAFRSWQTKLEFFGGIDWGNYEISLQDKIQPYRTKNYSAEMSLNTTPSRYLNLSYRFSWNRNEQRAKSVEGGKYLMRTHTHNGEIWIFPTKRLSINFNVDYQYYHEAVQRNTVFADALARYRFKKVELELECNNLFNAKNYMAISKTNMSTFISRYELRPVNALLKVRFKLK